MANATYDAWKQELLGDAGGPGHGTTDFEADNFKMILLDAADHTTNTATDADHANLTAGGIVATSANMTSMAVTIAAGTATVDCADFTWSAVTGDQSEEVVFYKDSGVSATSLLIINFDTFGSGMPVTPNGGDINVTVNASGIFTM